MEKIHMRSEKSMNLFETKMGYVNWLFIGKLFFYQFGNNSSELLLWKINSLTFLIWLIF